MNRWPGLPLSLLFTGLLAGCGSNQASVFGLTPTAPDASIRTAGEQRPLIREFAIRPNYAGVVPYDIVAGSNGAMWFTEQRGDAVGRVDRDGAVREFSLRVHNAQPQGIAAGPDGAFYVAETYGPTQYATHVARITTAGVITNWNDDNSMPLDVAAGPHGTMWFTQACSGLAVIDTQTGKITWRSVPTGLGGTQPSSGPILRGPDGSMWFSDDGATRIGRIDAAGKYRVFEGVLYKGKYGDATHGATVGPDGNIWWTASLMNSLWAMNRDGKVVAIHRVPTRNAVPWDVVAANGALWFTERNAGKIGRMTMDGHFTEYSLSSPNAMPQGIARASDGSIWFVESGADKVGRIAI